MRLGAKALISSYSARVWARVSVLPPLPPVVGVGVVGGVLPLPLLVVGVGVVEGVLPLPPGEEVGAEVEVGAGVAVGLGVDVAGGSAVGVGFGVRRARRLAGLAALVLRRRSARQLPGKGPICR